jgi:hypothetical protein
MGLAEGVADSLPSAASSLSQSAGPDVPVPERVALGLAGPAADTDAVALVDTTALLRVGERLLDAFRVRVTERLGAAA